MKVWFPTIKVSSGSDIYVERLAESLKRHGVETVISYFSSIYELAPFLLRFKKVPERTDIIHCNSWYAFPFASHGIPLVTTVHHPTTAESYSFSKSRLQKMYHRLLIRSYEHRSLEFASRIVCVSQFTADSVRNQTANKSISTIYNFIDTDQFSAKDAYSFTGSRPLRLLFVGNLSARKGYDLLHPIMNKLGSNYLLTVVSGLRDMGRHSSTENIKYAGHVDQSTLVNLYQDSDVLLFPTRLEGFGYAPAEAMSCGTPVIASANSAIPEVVIDHRTGLLCPTDDIDAFCNASEFFFNNPDKIGEYGQAGRERVVNHFSAEKITGQYLDLYNELLR